MSNPYGTGGSGPGADEVFIQGMTFTPATITVTAGTTITWTNKDSYAHTVTSDTPLFDSGNLGSNKSFTYTFATAGTFPYHCNIHTSMTAKVVVN
jgi:plastocyanin